MVLEAAGQGLRHIQNVGMSLPVLASMPLASLHTCEADGFQKKEPPTLPHLLQCLSLPVGCCLLSPSPAETYLSPMSRADLTLRWDLGSPVCWSQGWAEETQPKEGGAGK